MKPFNWKSLLKEIARVTVAAVTGWLAGGCVSGSTFDSVFQLFM